MHRLANATDDTIYDFQQSYWMDNGKKYDQWATKYFTAVANENDPAQWENTRHDLESCNFCIFGKVKKFKILITDIIGSKIGVCSGYWNPYYYHIYEITVFEV